MEFKVIVLHNKKSLGLRVLDIDTMDQAESGLLELLCDYAGVMPSQARCFHEVKTETLRRMLFYARVGKGEKLRLRVEISQMV